jgi:predicted nuclease of predicted toxin-antitoxin system
VKLLLDQNLSRRLVRELTTDYHESRHVTEVGLDTATDTEIWSWAGQHDYVIVSKDSDFRQLAFLHGPPPKAVWLRMGNVSTSEILEVLRVHREHLLQFEASDDEALLVLPTT